MSVPAFDRRRLPEGLTTETWPTADGQALRMFEWPAPAHLPRRGSLLFQSGRGDFLEKYLEAMAHWRGRGWDVAGFDWRGQGGSQKGGPGGLDDMLSDLEGFLKAWRGASAAPHVAIGHSMGGHLLLRLIAERSAAIDAAVLVAPMLGLNSRPVPPSIAAAIARGAVTMGLGDQSVQRRLTAVGPGPSWRETSLTGCPDRYADEADWLARTPDFALAPISWRWLADAFGSIERLRAPGALEAVATPILLLGAARDRLVDIAAIRSAAARLPHATLVVRDDSAHEMLRERDTVRVAMLAEIDAFLDAKAPA